MTTMSLTSTRLIPFALAAALAGLALLLSAAPAPAQASLLRDIAPGTRSSNPRECVEFDGKYFFTACPLGNRTVYYLYRTDGTAAGTAQFGANPVGFDVLPAGKRLYYTAQTASAGMELWVTDGVTPGTMVADLQPGTLGSGPGEFIACGDSLVFTASVATGRHLFVTDGTAAGTVGLCPLPAGVFGRRLAEQGGRVYFQGADGELWRTDGTQAGTQLVRDIRPGPAASNPGSLTAYQGRVWFCADDGVSGNELWYSDGTQLGTALFFEANPGSGGTTFSDFTVAGGQLFFPIRGRLFATDGIAAREVLANPPFSVRAGASFGSLTAFGNSVFFAGTNPATGTELWRSDGTSTGTWMVRDIWPGASDGLVGPVPLRVLGSRYLYFVGADPTSGAELWRSDGTTNGTQVAIDFVPGAGSSYSPLGGGLVLVSLVRGQLVFDPSEGNVGQEPFAFWPGASSQPIGWGCGATINGVVRRSRLAGSDAVLGGVVRFAGFDAPGGALGAIALGFQAQSPLQLANGCRVWMDLGTAMVLPAFWNTASGWQSNLALPMLPAYSGTTLVAQCFYLGSNAPGGYEVSNAVLLGLGF